MELTGFGRGKLILFGEHAAVYGLPAVGIPLPMETHVHITIPKESTGDWDLTPVEEPFRAAVASILDRAADLNPVVARNPGRVAITSSVPSGTGFGSSAAVSVAFAKVFSTSPYQNLGISHREIWEFANRLETAFHGTPSGIDTGLALSAGMRIFRGEPSLVDGPPPAPVLPDSEELESISFCFVAGSIPRRGDTKTHVADIHRRLREGDTGLRASLRRLGEISEEAARYLRISAVSGSTQIEAIDESARHERLAAVGERALEAHEILSKMGLSTDALDAILEVGRRYGALGGKLSGAGGGGAFFLLFADREATVACLQELSRNHPTTPASRPDRPLPDMHLWSFEWTPRGAVSLA